MKKLPIFVLVFSLLVFMLLDCTAQQPETSLTLSENTAQTTAEAVQSVEEAVAPPPHILIFQSLREYSDLLSALELPENELTDFLQEKSYYYNGIETAEDIRAFCEKLEQIPFPLLSDGQLSGIVVYPEDNSVDVLYALDADTRCVFDIDMDENSADTLYEKIKARTALTERIDVDNMNALYYYEPQKSRDADPYPAYIADADGHYVLFTTHGFTRAAAEELLPTVSFTSCVQGAKSPLRVQ